MIINIPGYKTLDLRYLILDYNGTIALDGEIPSIVKKQLTTLSADLDIYVLTADTHGTARQVCEGLPLTIMTFPNGSAMDEKKRIVNDLGKEFCITVGNGRNDLLMCQDGALSIAILGAEGAYGKLIAEADICVSSISDGLDLLLKPKRLIATLRG